MAQKIPSQNLGHFGKKDIGKWHFASFQRYEKDLKFQRVPSEILIKSFESLMVCRDHKRRLLAMVKLTFHRRKRRRCRLIRQAPIPATYWRENVQDPGEDPARKRAKRATDNVPEKTTTRYKVLIGINIEPAQSDYHAPPRETTNRCKGR